MSAPIDDDHANDRLKYAPPWARQQRASHEDTPAPAAPPDQTASAATRPQPHGSAPAALEPAALEPPTVELGAHPRDLDLPLQVLRPAKAPVTMPEEADPAAPWQHAPVPPFEGDRAVRELRARMALNPHAVPEPPELRASHFHWKSVWRAIGITLFAASAAFAAVMFLFPEARRIVPAHQTSIPSGGTSPAKTDRAATPAGAPEPSHLVVAAKRIVANNAPAPLGVSLAGAPAHGAVLVSGLAANARLSHGAPISAGTWRVPLTELDQATVIPPDDFVGTMEIAVALLTADAKVTDKSTVAIEWATATTGSIDSGSPAARSEMSPSAAPLKRSDLRTLDRDEIEGLVKRGRDFIANGDLAAARLVLRRAANGGDAQAALLLGTTFDPATFEKLRVIGAAPDPAEARNWYRRAIELGSVEAERRLAPLARGAR